jgi:hypothetical protein
MRIAYGRIKKNGGSFVTEGPTLVKTSMDSNADLVGRS